MKNLVGEILIAPPNVRGNFFEKSVILITENNTNGSIGIALNKASKVSLKEFARQNNVMLDIPGSVYIGGPVNVKALTMIHTNDWSCGNTMRIDNNFSISSSSEILTKIAMGQTPDHWRVFVGLCSWSKGQLQQELEGAPPYNRNKSWITASSEVDTVFGQTGQEQWTKSVERSASEFAQTIFS